MPIDFSDPEWRDTYAGRRADASWIEAMTDVAGEVHGCVVVDLGCGGGIYSRAWLDLGAARVIGVDGSAPFLETAREAVADARFETRHADVSSTGLPEGAADVVFARALIHHLPDLSPFLHETTRLLRPGGRLIVQDRTLEDVQQPPSSEHLRGYFFSVYPRLLAIEARRRPSIAHVTDGLAHAGFTGTSVRRLWETRRHHPSVRQYQDDLRARTGRSILHELSDDELEVLVAHVGEALPPGPVAERDAWTLWTAALPG